MEEKFTEYEQTSGEQKKSSYLRIFLNGLIDENPTFVQLLGACPTLATTTSLINSLGMGISATVVLAFSNLFISLVRKLIPSKIRIAAYIVIIAGFVSAVDMILKAYFPAISSALGIFIPLIVVNCIILARAESFASKNKPLPSLVDGVAMGLGFTLAISIIGAVREILGNGSILGISLFGANYQPAMFFIMPAGGFITFGLILGVIAFCRGKKYEKMGCKGACAGCNGCR